MELWRVRPGKVERVLSDLPFFWLQLLDTRRGAPFDAPCGDEKKPSGGFSFHHHELRERRFIP